MDIGTLAVLFFIAAFFDIVTVMVIKQGATGAVRRAKPNKKVSLLSAQMNWPGKRKLYCHAK